MKTPNLQQTMGLAVILTSAGIVLAVLAGALWPRHLHLPGVILCVLACGYAAYLLGLNGRRRGWTAWLAAGAALLICVYYVTMPWLVFLVSVLLLACRQLVFRRSVLPALADTALALIAALSFFWACSLSFLFAVWTFFLVHAGTALIPRKFSSGRTCGGESAPAAVRDRFAEAAQAAEAALRQMQEE